MITGNEQNGAARTIGIIRSHDSGLRWAQPMSATPPKRFRGRPRINICLTFPRILNRPQTASSITVSSKGRGIFVVFCKIKYFLGYSMPKTYPITYGGQCTERSKFRGTNAVIVDKYRGWANSRHPECVLPASSSSPFRLIVRHFSYLINYNWNIWELHLRCRNIYFPALG